MSVHLESFTPLGQDRREDVGRAATQLEAYFLRLLLKEFGGTSAGLLDGGVSGQMFHDMFSEALADAMAQGRGLGIATLVESQLEKLAPAAPGSLFTRGRMGGAYGAAAQALTAAPVAGAIGSGYGPRIHPVTGQRHFHTGVDIATSAGTPVGAVGPGRIARASAVNGYGNVVVIDHGGGLETMYAHLSEIQVASGDGVQVGQTVGLVGSSGRSTGPHLHFEVRRGGKPVDPEREIPEIKDWRIRSSR